MLTPDQETAFRHVDTLMRMKGQGSRPERAQYLVNVETKEGEGMRWLVERLFKYRWETEQEKLKQLKARV